MVMAGGHNCTAIVQFGICGLCCVRIYAAFVGGVLRVLMK